MNIRDFLINNYIWILVVLLLTIVTIIGFLADKKRGKKEPKNVNTGGNNISNGVPINYQNVQGGYPQQGQTLMNGQNMGMNQVNNQPLIYPQMNQPQPAENVSFQNIPNSSLTPNNMVNNFNNAPQTGQVEQSQMVNPMGMPQPMEQFNNMNQMNVIPNNNMMMNQPQPVENVNNNVINAEPMYQPLSEQTPVIPPQNVPNYNPQPVQSVPIMDNGNALNNQVPNNMGMGNMNEQMNMSNNMVMEPVVNNSMPVNQGQLMPNGMPNTVPTPVNNQEQTNPQAINFVYGPQNNNQ